MFSPFVVYSFFSSSWSLKKTNHCMDCSISVVSILLLMLNIIYINCGAAYAPTPQDTLPDEFVQFIDGCMPCQPGQVNIFVFGDTNISCRNSISLSFLVSSVVSVFFDFLVGECVLSSFILCLIFLRNVLLIRKCTF